MEVSKRSLISRSGRFTPGKEKQNPLNKRQGGPQSRSGRLYKERKSLPIAGIRTRIEKLVISRYIDIQFLNTETHFHDIPLLMLWTYNLFFIFYFDKNDLLGATRLSGNSRLLRPCRKLNPGHTTLRPPLSLSDNCNNIFSVKTILWNIRTETTAH
jgi:hypothetical protein